MNDFNLLELNHIADGLARLTAHYSFSVGLHEDILRLYGKVESMIDKYDDNFECEFCHSLRSKNSPNAFCCGNYKYEQ